MSLSSKSSVKASWIGNSYLRPANSAWENSPDKIANVGTELRKKVSRWSLPITITASGLDSSSSRPIWRIAAMSASSCLGSSLGGRSKSWGACTVANAETILPMSNYLISGLLERASGVPGTQTSCRTASRGRETDVLIVAESIGLRQAKPSPRPAERGDSVSRCERVGLFDINLEILDRLLDHRSLNFPFAQQFMERRQRDEARVHLEEVAKRFSALAAAESVGSKRGQPPGHPLAHHI